MAVQMQRVHAQLKGSVWGAWGRHLTDPTAPVPAPSVTRLLEMWDYEGSLLMQVTSLLHARKFTATTNGEGFSRKDHAEDCCTTSLCPPITHCHKRYSTFTTATAI